MPANRTIFITGATGFLGTELVDELMKSSEGYDIYALVRDSGESLGHKVKKIRGEITKDNLGLDKNVVDNLVASIDVIYHLAAITDLNRPMKELKRVNVDGTKNVLDFAMACKKNGKHIKVNHVSTSYVAGARCAKRCRVMERDLNLGQRFNNRYEQTKSEAEELIAGYRQGGLDVDIFRPSIILGRYRDGMTTSFKMLYQPMHYFSLELFDRIPAPVYNVGNLINLDTAARAICLISTSSKKENMNYHITSPDTVALDYILGLASAYFGFKKPEFVPAEDLYIDSEYTPVKRKMLEPYSAYFNYGAEFDMTNTLGALRGSDFTFPEFGEKNFTRLFEYCAASGFIKRKSHVVVG